MRVSSITFPGASGLIVWGVGVSAPSSLKSQGARDKVLCSPGMASLSPFHLTIGLAPTEAGQVGTGDRTYLPEKWLLDHSQQGLRLLFILGACQPSVGPDRLLTLQVAL